MSYQLWNNYLLKNPHYQTYLLSPEMIKGFHEIKIFLQDKVKYAQNTLHPPSSGRNSCTVMITHIMAEPDWIVIECNQCIFGMIVCQNIINETTLTKNQLLLNKTGMKTCNKTAFHLENKCIMFKKYEKFTNFSEWTFQNDVHILEINILAQKFTDIFMENFTSIQHFYDQVIQFTIPISFSKAYLSYKTLQNHFFLKINWIQIQNINPTSKHNGYMIFSRKQESIKIPSNVFQCLDGTYIDDTSICNGILDCTAGTDEQLCHCNNTEALVILGCKYVHSSDKNYHQVTCSTFYFACVSSIKCIPYDKFCDGYQDCLFAEDEICTNELSKKVKNIAVMSNAPTFICSERYTTIPIFFVNDLIPDCPNSIEDEIQYYSLVTDPFHTQDVCNKSQELPCVHGHSHCFKMDKLCIFKLQYNTTALKHCRNGAHLYNCSPFKCSEHFKCSVSYCTPFELVCDGKWDCPQGGDQINCYSFSCPNLFKCRNQTKCLHLSKICNNINECRFGDDES